MEDQAARPPLVGTSGFAYPEWRPAFYPEGLPQRAFLAHYATRLTACEINATFYRLQAPTTVARWAAEVPEGFRFAAKAHRGLTHGALTAPAGDLGGLLERFVASLAPFGERLGAVLIQMPPRKARDDAALTALARALPQDLPWALDARHPSWADPGVEDLVAGLGGTVCVSEAEGNVPDSLPPGPLGYVRLRAGRYDDDAREGWRELLSREAAARPVLCFAKHEGVAAGDPHAGVGLAEWLVSPGGRGPA
ncbi:MAG: DUF72 domain-containing protein [Thermoleophilia bacterium]|jgi:uncharacterized protein YecE (DUF72 family)|nr:DUF72 domain-containing protein [Thermoleophilia bacterium]